MLTWYFVVGASSGIGEATALYLAPFGVKLVLSARNEERLQQVAKECHNKGLSTDKVIK